MTSQRYIWDGTTNHIELEIQKQVPLSWPLNVSTPTSFVEITFDKVWEAYCVALCKGVDGTMNTLRVFTTEEKY